MEVVSLKQVEIDAGHEVLLEKSDFSFGDDTRVGLVGANGSGKSTLLRAIVGLAEVSQGRIIVTKGSRVEYVPQAIPPDLIDTPALQALLDKIETDRPDIEEWRAYDILTRFGLGDHFERTLGSLSGGEGNRAMLARALVVEPDFLLLDEPTNHMDSLSIVKFEKLLQDEIRIPFCIVSHDRTLLDRVTSETIFLRDRRLHYFGLPFSKAKEALLEHDEARRQDYLDEAKEIERLRKSAEQMKGWVKTNSDLATRYQALKRRIAQMEENRTFVSREKRRRISVASSELSVKAAIRIPEFEVRTPTGDFLYKVDNFAIAPGDRIVILGRNGAGKTTLLRMIVAAFEDQNNPAIRFNPQVRLGYYDQELRRLDLEASIFDHVQSITKLANEQVRKELIAAGFPYGRHQDKIEKLSGGEKARLQFSILKLLNSNLMILDEPTNHIDVDGLEHLEFEIDASDATFIMVSHDRTFIRNVATRYFLIDGGRLTEIDDIDTYHKAIFETPAEPARTTSAKNKKANGQGKVKAQENRKEMEVPETEDEVMRQIALLEDKIQADPDSAETLKTQLDSLYRRWQVISSHD